MNNRHLEKFVVTILRIRAAANACLLPHKPVIGAAFSLVVLSHFIDLTPNSLGVGHLSAPASAALVHSTVPAIPAPNYSTEPSVGSETDAQVKGKNRPVRSPNGFMMPLAKMVTTSAFGVRVHPVTGNVRHHQGVDLRAKLEEPVFAVLPGRVVSAGSRGGYGNAVEIYHPSNNTSTMYAHLNSIWVEQGMRVAKGTAVGGAGTTGVSTGVHLHFEVRGNGGHMDPVAFLNDAELPPVSIQIAREAARNSGQPRSARINKRTSSLVAKRPQGRAQRSVVASAKATFKSSPRTNRGIVVAKASVHAKPTAAKPAAAKIVAKAKPDLSGLERKLAEATAAAEKFKYLHEEGVVSRVAAAEKSAAASAAMRAFTDAKASL